MQRKTKLVIVSIVTAVVTAVALVAVSTAVSESAAQATTVPARNNLDKGTHYFPCDKPPPLAERQGGFVCDAPLRPPRRTSTLSLPAATTGAVQPAPAGALATTGWCRPSGTAAGGCWWRLSDFVSTYERISKWGFFSPSGGLVMLGTFQFNMTFKLAGTALVSYTNFHPTHAVNNVITEGHLYNGAVGKPGGGTILPKYTDYRYTASMAPYTSIKSRFFHYDYAMYNHNVKVTISWNVVGFPGTWHLSARSLVSHSDNRVFYKFVKQVPYYYGLSGDPETEGWHSW